MRRFAWIGLVLLFSMIVHCTVYSEIPSTRESLQMTNESRGFQSSYTSRGPIAILSDADFSRYGFPGTGDENTPYRIEGYNITDSNYELIVIENTEAFFVIQQNYLDSITSSLDGIYIRNAKNGLVYNNTAVNNRHGIFIDKGCQSINITLNEVSDTSQSGIRINGSTDVRVRNNEIYQNTYNGIWANYSTHLEIWNNTIYDDELGIWLRNSNSCQVFENLLFGNDNGIWISNQSTSNNIAFNRIFDPDNLNPNTCGIHLSHNASENNILLNTVENSTEHGFYVEASSGNNTIKWNAFIGNNIGGTSQALDHASVNVQYNYWSDWTTPDANLDQIVDFPYALEGAAMNEDPFPLTRPANASVVHFLTPIRVLSPNGGEEITDSAIIQWTPSYDSENHAVNYSIYVSSNSGADWEKKVENLTTTQYEWDTTSELKSTHYLIRVIAECSGGLNVSDESDGEFSLIPHTLSEVVITSPANSGPFDRSLMIGWDAVADSWGWSVSYSLQYSSTGGYDWNDLASGLTDTTYQWDISQLEEDNTYVVKIIASADGGLSSEAISVLFSIQHVTTTTTPTTPTGGPDLTPLLVGGVGITSAVVAIIVVILLKKKRASKS
ncbi:MAG: right-handed parallel beta-helix repeat-containing protein [Promethearchaeota archaeon]